MFPLPHVLIADELLGVQSYIIYASAGGLVLLCTVWLLVACWCAKCCCFKPKNGIPEVHLTLTAAHARLASILSLLSALFFTSTLSFSRFVISLYANAPFFLLRSYFPFACLSLTLLNLHH